MKTRFKTIGGALALTLMLLFSAVAFERTANASVANPSMSAPEMQWVRNERWNNRRHHRHMDRVIIREGQGFRGYRNR